MLRTHALSDFEAIYAHTIIIAHIDCDLCRGGVALFPYCSKLRLQQPGFCIELVVSGVHAANSMASNSIEN